MKRHHIAILTGGGAAHILPVLGLCSALANRGYRLTYVATDDDAAKIQGSGAERVAIRMPTIQHPTPLISPSCDDPRYWPFLASLMAPWTFQVAERVVIEIEDYYRTNPPDLILYDRFALAGRILAKRFRCRAVQLWPSFAHQASLIREGTVCRNPDAMLGFSMLMDSYLATHGIQGRNSLWHKEELNLHFLPREFQFDADSFDRRFCFTGHSLHRPPGIDWENNSGGKPIILVSESTASRSGSEYLNQCITAFAESEYHVVLSVGERSFEYYRDRLPRNIELNRNAYNVEILPHAVLTICQGGMGTILDSIYNLVPAIAIPLTPWHTEVAHRLVELGLGVHLPERNLNANALGASVDEILKDTALRHRVQVTGRSYAASGGLELAVDRIEALLSQCVSFTRGGLCEPSASLTS